jgi:hypothetical protein
MRLVDTFWKNQLLDTRNETAQITLTGFLNSFYFLSAEEQLVKSQLLNSQLLESQLLDMLVSLGWVRLGQARLG